MPVINSIADSFDEMAGWRRHIHRNPELGLECHNTASFIVDLLRDFGVDEISQGWAKTGVVAVINGRGDGGTIGLRADMDALPIHEACGLEYRSQIDGAMHACGHDGHTAMLLGAAKYLAATRNFSGRVILIFQPDEESGGGAGVMCNEGLLEKYRISQIYALHNMPDLAVGQFETRAGPLMASVDDFEIEVSGTGGHAARPHALTDPIACATAMVQSFYAIVSRNVDPVECGVLSITQIHAGASFNVIPAHATIAGTLRSFEPVIRETMRKLLISIMENTAASYDVTVKLTPKGNYPSTINNPEKAAFSAQVAAQIVGQENVSLDAAPRMIAEDFSFMLNKVPGAYVLIGNGRSAPLHDQTYNFNDEISPIGASYFARLVEAAQPVSASLHNLKL